MNWKKFKNASKQEIYFGIILLSAVGGYILIGFLEMYKLGFTVLSIFWACLSFFEWSAVYQSHIYKNERNKLWDNYYYAIVVTLGFIAIGTFTVSYLIKNW